MGANLSPPESAAALIRPLSCTTRGNHPPAWPQATTSARPVPCLPAFLAAPRVLSGAMGQLIGARQPARPRTNSSPPAAKHAERQTRRGDETVYSGTALTVFTIPPVPPGRTWPSLAARRVWTLSSFSIQSWAGCSVCLHRTLTRLLYYLRGTGIRHVWTECTMYCVRCTVYGVRTSPARYGAVPRAQHSTVRSMSVPTVECSAVLELGTPDA